MHRIAAVAGLALLISGTQLQAACAQPAALPLTPVQAESARTSPANGPSSDADTIADAAADYASGNNAAAAAELAASASEVEAVPMEVTNGGLAIDAADGAEVVVTVAGEVTLRAPGMPEVGLSVAGNADSTKVVEGALVQTGVAASTDIVTRATEEGVQLVAILGDSSAPNDIEFNVDLPTGAEFVTQPDGSLAVVAPIREETYSQTETDQFTARVAEVIGEAADLTQLDQDQWTALEALPVPKPVIQVAERQIATVAAPWAVDAVGNPVDTHYEVHGDTLVQVVDPDVDTVFPVTADPAWWWWVWTATSCVADLSTFIFAAAKLAKILVKISGIVAKSATVAKWVKKLGGAEQTIKSIYKAAKGFVESGRIGKYLSSTEALALSGFASAGLTLVGDALGIGSCVSLIREML